ncbi:transposase, partial [Myxacorys almedinensis]|uniref:transposase n=1 Tax=Myxacorys almedinensis TaxID=2651157 RepID=UPI003B75CDC4
FYEEVIYDWAGEDKRASDFERDGPKIVIILDNSSIHKNKDFVEKIKLEMPNLVLEFLPEYSPDYNLIELVWHSTKEFVANRLFKSIEDLEIILNKLLNEGELVINWNRKVKNKGNAQQLRQLFWLFSFMILIAVTNYVPAMIRNGLGNSISHASATA